MTVRRTVNDDQQIIAALANAMAIRKGIRNRTLVHSGVFESEFSPFSDDHNADAIRFMRLQGYDLNMFREQSDTDVMIEVHEVESDRVLVVAIAY